MPLLGILGLIQTVAGGLLDLGRKYIPDKDKQALFEKEVMTMQANLLAKQIDANVEELKAGSAAVVAEANGESWLQRNWRPMVMMVFTGLVVCYWFGIMPVNTDQTTILELFSIVKVGLGGYVIGRSAEKVATTVAGALKK
jgi:hypothetical protein